MPTPSTTAQLNLALISSDVRLRSVVEFALRGASQYKLTTDYPHLLAALTALPKLRRIHRPRVVLIGLPVLPHVLRDIRRLKQLLPKTHLILLTAAKNPERRILKAIQAGVVASLPQDSIQLQLLPALDSVMTGGTIVPTTVTRKLISLYQTQESAPSPATRPYTEPLTQREEQVLKAMGNGDGYKEIARVLHISFHTVRAHVQNIQRKLNVRRRADAVRKYKQWST